MDSAGLELWIGLNYILSGNFRQLMPAALIVAYLGRYLPMTDASKKSKFLYLRNFRRPVVKGPMMGN